MFWHRETDRAMKFKENTPTPKPKRRDTVTEIMLSYPRPTELRLIGCSTESMWTQKNQIKHVDTKNQLADILTKGNFTRDEWNNLLYLFNISIFSSASCLEVMSKRKQQGTGEERIAAKTKPTLNLLSRSATSSPTANKFSQKSVVSWSQFTLSLPRPHRRLGFKSSRSASPCGASCASSMGRRLRARSSRAFPLVYWRVGHWPLPTSTSLTTHSLWSPGAVALGALRGSSLARSGSVSGLLEHAWENTAVARFVSSGACLLVCSSAVPTLKTRDEVPLSHFSLSQFNEICWYFFGCGLAHGWYSRSRSLGFGF